MSLASVSLAQLVASRLAPEAAVWFGRTLSEVGAVADEVAFQRAWNAAGRRLGRAPLQLKPAEGAALPDQGRVFSNATLDEAGRAALLLAALPSFTGEQQLALVSTLFHTGEMRERQALLRTLSWVPGPERFVEVAAEGVRQNMVSVIEAIACDNGFPADHMPDLLFNQMVMKALFNELPLGRVVGLARRRNHELMRMVGAWVSERRAAGRSIPEDVYLILAR